jgi:hypothetical protein
VLGIAPQLAVVYFFRPMLAAFGLDATLNVTWLGMFSGAGSYSTVGGLALALVSFVLGGAIFALARMSGGTPVRTASAGSGMIVLGGGPGGVFTGGEPLWEQDRLTASDFSRIFEQNWQTFFHWTNVDRVYGYIVHGLRAAARELAARVSWLEKHAFACLCILSAALVIVGASMRQTISFSEGRPLPPMPEILIAAACIAAVALVCAAAEASDDRLLPLQITLPATCAVLGCMIDVEWLRYGLLECAALLSIVPVWKSVRDRALRHVYPTVVIFAGLCLGISEVLGSSGEMGGISRTLLFTSVCVKFAAVPFSFWLLRLADEVPGLVLALVAAVVDMSAVGELSLRARMDPALFTPAAPWLVVALVTSIAAAFLMLTQRSMKRLLVLSSIEDIGFLMLGIASLSTLGEDGVMLAAASHALGKCLLFVCIALPEHDGVLDTDGGLAGRYPFSAFGFLIGMLALLGIPPTLGFAGRWKLYVAALSIHPALLAGFLLASILALIAYISAFRTLWWGTPRHHESGASKVGDPVYPLPPKRESLILKLVIVALVASLLCSGLWPQMIVDGFRGARP